MADLTIGTQLIILKLNMLIHLWQSGFGTLSSKYKSMSMCKNRPLFCPNKRQTLSGYLYPTEPQ